MISDRATSPRLRVLLAHHAPLGAGSAGGQAVRIENGLLQNGHAVHVLRVIDDHQAAADHARPIVCHPTLVGADLPFARPEFASEASGSTMPFEELNEWQWIEYRDTLRRALDCEIDSFDPHLVHAQHAWLLGHLALEAGIPYVLTIWPSELDTLARDLRFRRIAQEAAENAGRLLVSDDVTRRRAMATFVDIDPERITVLTDDERSPLVEQVEAAYCAVLQHRFGDKLRP